MSRNNSKNQTGLFVDFNMQSVMQMHGLGCIFLGLLAIVSPHGLHSSRLAIIKQGLPTQYNHMAHEFIRLYGCLNLGIGWFVWSTRQIQDGRLVRAISETFCICYFLQSITIFRAQWTDPTGHSVIHWMIALLFLTISGLYGYIRYNRKLKSFQLPSLDD